MPAKETSQPLLTQSDIADIIARLAAETTQVLPIDFVVVGLMDGAMMFTADYMREIFRLGFNPVFESLSLSSYGDDHHSSGQVVCNKDIQRPVKDCHVLILDDVFETGLTLNYAKTHVLNLGAASVTTCVFAQKPHHKSKIDQPDYVGWHAPDQFLIGYGLDDKSRYRGQPFISQI